MVILLCLLCAAPAAAVGHQHVRAADSGAEALVGADRVGESPRRLSGYVMDDSTIRTAVDAWLSDSAAAEVTYGHISTWDTSGVTDMSYLFCGKSKYWCGSDYNSGASSFNEDISAWDTSGVKSMYKMFWHASAFNQDLSDWSLDIVWNLNQMFEYASAFDQDLGWCIADDAELDYAFSNSGCASTSCGVAWAAAVRCGGSGGTIDDGTIKTAVDRWLSSPAAAEATYGHISTWETGGVTDMTALFFRGSTFDEDISAWDTSGVTDMDAMFSGAKSFNRPIGGWRVDRVRSMASMFSGASAFNQPIGNWSVGAVTYLDDMFREASAFNNPIGAWRVDQVTTTRGMFAETQSFNQPLGSWRVDSVTDMKQMFFEAKAFNQDLGDWQVDTVTNMKEMFQRAKAFDQDLGWCVDHSVDMDDAFDSTPCKSTSCGVTHGICWGRGKNRKGVGLVLVVVICLILAICVPLAVSCCFLAGTFGSCSKHKKTQSMTQLPGSPSSDSTVSNSTDAFF